MTTNLSRRRIQLDAWQALLIAAVVLYIVIFAAQAFALHGALRTHRSDLGQIDQAVWNSSRGRFLEQTDNGFVASRLTDHVEPALVLISPVFWLWNDVRALLLLQAIAVAAAAWPLYHLALRRLDRCLAPDARAHIWQWEPLRHLTRPIAFALAIAWLLASPLQSAVLTEFHAAPLAAPLILWALWAVEAQRWRQFAVAALLVAAIKEEMALAAALLGLWAVWRAWRLLRDGESVSMRAGALWGATVAALSLAWFALATFVIVPHFARELYGVAESGYFARYGALGDSPLDIVRSLVTRPASVWVILGEPARLNYLRDLLLIFAFLPILAPDVLLLSLPLLAANVLSAYPAQYYGEFHYSAPVVAYFAAAAAFGAGRLWGWLWHRTTRKSPTYQHLPAASTGVMAAVSAVQNAATAVRPLAAWGFVLWIGAWAIVGYAAAGRGPFGGRFDSVQVEAHDRRLARFVAQIPRDASLTATAALHPHVSHRQFVYQFPLGLDAPQPATWALLDVTTNTDMAPGDLKARVEQMLASGWGVVDAADGYLLLADGQGASTIPEEFYSFVRLETAGEGAEASSSGVLVDDWPRWRQTRLTGVWPTWDPVDSPPRVEVFTPDGSIIPDFESATPPALVWLPDAQWQAGSAYEATSLPMWLPRSVAVRASGADELTVLRRVKGDRLIQRALGEVDVKSYGPAVYALTTAGTTPKQATFAGDTSLNVTAWLETRPPRPGDTVDLWLQWRGKEWPAGYVPFVHLRRDGVNVAQADGPPRLFDRETAPTLAKNGYANDWRALAIPPDAPVDGEYAVVVGLYDPASGARMPLAGGGDEFTAGTLHLRRAVPDQACALIPASCATQW